MPSTPKSATLAMLLQEKHRLPSFSDESIEEIGPVNVGNPKVDVSIDRKKIFFLLKNQN